jgi:hypothetical protein
MVPTVERGLVPVVAEELARVGGERFDVAPLPLGVERVEGQGRLSRSGDARQDHELLLGDPDVDGTEVVLAGASNANVVELHEDPKNRPSVL